MADELKSNSTGNPYENKELVKEFYGYNPVLFELYVMYVLMHDYDVWRVHMCDVVNEKYTDKGKTFKYADFTKPIDNTIYEIVSRFYMLYKTSEDQGEPPVMTPETVLKAFENRPKENSRANTPEAAMEALMAESEGVSSLSQLKARLEEIERVCKNEESHKTVIVPCVVSGLSHFLNIRRVKQVTALQFGKYVEPDQMIERIRTATSSIGSCEIERGTVKDALFKDEEDVERMSIISLPKTTKCLGGGLGKGESYLFVAPPGGGKTVIACQITAGIAAIGKKAVYITTEQRSNMLVPRMVSCMYEVPFERIKDGIPAAKKAGILSKSDEDSIQEFLDTAGPNLYFENWCNSGGKILTNLESTIRQYKNEIGLDFLCIDWLGGGISIPPSQGDKLRFYYKNAAMKIKELCQMYNISILVTAQASAVKSKDISRVSAEQISECTALDESFTAGMGISVLTEGKKQDFNKESNTIKVKQFFNWFKMRKGVTLAYPVQREFGFQKFVEKTLTDNNELINGATFKKLK